MTALFSKMIGGVTCGDCIDVMAHMPAACVDFILTDPPYLVRYRDRSGRTLANDDNDVWLEPAFRQMHRVLRRDAFCVSFYGWNATDRFMTAWKQAGFRVAGHIVFRKKYASSKRFLSRQHESAYLLVKGNPRVPAKPLPDVLDWSYSGNRLHPTQKPLSILRPLVESFTAPGNLVFDPFSGSGSTLVAAQELGRRSIGIELDPKYHRTASERLQALALPCAA